MTEKTANFAQLLDGPLYGVLQWAQLDDLWAKLKATPEGWYASLVGDVVPTTPLAADALRRLVDDIDALLRREHKHDFCGIVYVDSREQPGFVKIFDPHNLGSSCSCSATPIPPRWVLSRCQPEPIHDDAPLPSSRRHWWQRVLSWR